MITTACQLELNTAYKKYRFGSGAVFSSFSSDHASDLSHVTMTDGRVRKTRLFPSAEREIDDVWWGMLE